MTVVTIGSEVGGISVYSGGGLLLQYLNAWLMNIVAILMDKVLGLPRVSDFNHCDVHGSDCRSQRKAAH
jgi:hypothetical protein